MKVVTALIGLLAASAALAQTRDLEFGGYVKYLVSRSDAPKESVSLNHLLHARLNGKWYPTEDLSAILELRTRVYYGDIVAQTPGFAGRLSHDAGFGTLGLVLWDRKKTVGYSEIDRCFVNWGPGSWQISFGRQRIAWGTNLVWNPIDLYNPQSVLDFDYEERPAVDAVRVQYYTGGISKFEIAIKPGTGSTKSINAVQWTTNKWDYDFHFLGGWRSGDWFVGTGWAGDILGGGFRGEFLASKKPESLRQGGAGGVMVTAAVSGDYTFPNSLYIHTEVLYSNQGVVRDAALARASAQASGMLSPARWSIFQEVAYDVSPLVRGDLFVIFNPTDHSAAFVPSAMWSIVTNFDVTLLSILFNGNALTEFGQLGTDVYVRGKWSF